MIYTSLFVPLALAAAASAQTPAPAPLPAVSSHRVVRPVVAPAAVRAIDSADLDLSGSQEPLPAMAPMPPDPPDPAPRPMPRPAVAPVPPGALFQVKPMPMPAPVVAPKMPSDFDFDFNFDFDFDTPAMEKQFEAAAKAMAYADKTMAGADKAMLLAQNMQIRGRLYQSEDRAYESGLNALDNHRYDAALESFNQVISRGGSRIDAAWYWKAYTLNKLGRRDDALAALAELRKVSPSSRWLDDAKALELEVKQQSGKPVSPEDEADEDLKLMALNSLMQSDPERALPLVEKLLKGSNSPRVKQRALYVLAVNNSPRAQQVLEQMARGGGNPDMQIKAINYLGSMRRRQGGNTNTTPPLLAEIYASSNDPNVKRAIFNVYAGNRETARIAEMARNEKDPGLRRDAFAYLGTVNGQPELWQIYQSEGSNDVKEQILGCMYNNGNAEKLAEVARTEKDPKLRRVALRVLATQRTPASGASLTTIYAGEQDEQTKKEIINNLRGQNNAKALVDLAKNEKDQKMKLYIVERLSNMKAKEATDYLEELLSR